MIKTVLEIALWVGGAVVLLVGFWNVQFQWRLRKHHGMSRALFLAYFEERGFKTEPAAAVYDYYRSHAIWRSFGVAPEDEIAALFNQAEEDIEDDFMIVLKRLGLEIPSDDAWDAWGRPPVRTVEQLVAAIAWASQHQPS